MVWSADNGSLSLADDRLFHFGTIFNVVGEKPKTMILILGTSLATAMALDARMLDQQISLCDDIISKIKAGDTDKVEVYQEHLWWLQIHCNTLDYYRRDMLEAAEEMSYLAQRYKPAFITDEYIARSKAQIKDGK